MNNRTNEVQRAELDAMRAEGVTMAVHMASAAAFVFESDTTRQMTVEEALQWAHKREASRLAGIEQCLSELRAEGVTTALELDAATLHTLESAGFYFDFDTGKVGRGL